MDQARTKTNELWEELQRRNNIVSHWINKKLGPSFCSLQNSVAEYWSWLKVVASEYWQWLKVEAARLWTEARPHLQWLGEQILQYSRITWTWLETNLKILWTWLEKNVPVYYEMAYQKGVELIDYGQNAVNNLMS